MDEQQVSGMDGYILTQLQVAIRFFQEVKLGSGSVGAGAGMDRSAVPSSSATTTPLPAVALTTMIRRGTAVLHTRPTNDDSTQTEEEPPRLPPRQPDELFQLQQYGNNNSSTPTNMISTASGASPPTQHSRVIVATPTSVRQLVTIFEGSPPQ